MIRIDSISKNRAAGNYVLWVVTSYWVDGNSDGGCSVYELHHCVRLSVCIGILGY